MSEHRDCLNCKHHEKRFHEEPCKSCTTSADNYSKWEPKPEARPQPQPPPLHRVCRTCRYEDLDSGEEPCTTCIVAPLAYSKWEPKPEEQPQAGATIDVSHTVSCTSTLPGKAALTREIKIPVRTLGNLEVLTPEAHARIDKVKVQLMLDDAREAIRQLFRDQKKCPQPAPDEEAFTFTREYAQLQITAFVEEVYGKSDVETQHRILWALTHFVNRLLS